MCLPASEVKTIKAFAGEKFVLTINKKGGFEMNPLQHPQVGWKEAFNKIADENNETLLLSETQNEFDEKE